MKTYKPIEKACMDAMHGLIQTKMLNHITVQDILSTAAVPKATFYRHYKNKADLFKKTLCRDIEDIFTDDCDLDYWYVRVHQIIQSFQQEKKIMSKLAKSDPERFQTFYTSILYDLLLKRLNRLHNQPFTMTPTLHRRFLFMSAGAVAIIQDWVMNNCIQSSGLIADEIITLFAHNARNTPLESETTHAKSKIKSHLISHEPIVSEL